MDKNKKYYSVSEVADLLGISRIAVHKKIKNKQIKAERNGRNFIIPINEVRILLGTKLRKNEKVEIEKAVSKVVKEYKKTLELLGAE